MALVWPGAGRDETHLVRGRVQLKRVYEPATASDGYRILVDGLWPRGVSKRDAAVDEWLKEIAPSTELRHWFGHDPEKWRDFQRRYRREVQSRDALVRRIVDQALRGPATLVYAARDADHNASTVSARIVHSRLTRTSEPRDESYRTPTEGRIR
jgi:uncharacterized protein YeaO (DUF488 family)